MAALWDELHTRQPWRNAAGKGAPLEAFGAERDRPANATRLLAFLGINTVSGWCQGGWARAWGVGG